MSDPVFDALSVIHLERVRKALERCLPAADTAPVSLHRAMRYAILGNGKRLRPLLCYATGQAIGVADDQLDAAASALELVHGFSLVHDDLPAMDDDDLRRGRPTVHKAFGTDIAILAGDALQTLAFDVLAQADREPSVIVRQQRTLAEATLGMTCGQVMDLEAEGRSIGLDELTVLNDLKTGCLIRAAILLAADARADLPADEREDLDTFARNIGLAFQIRDDLLDVEGDVAITGKTSGADAAHDKATWPSLIGLEATHARLDEAFTTAMNALERFGDKAGQLRHLARRIAYRDR